MPFDFDMDSISPIESGGGSVRVEPLDITPTTSAQSILPNTGYAGFNIVNVSGVNSSIDANITAGNIRKDVTILGVTGTVEAGSVGAVGSYMVVNGVVMPQDKSLTNRFDGIVQVSSYALNNAFNGQTKFNTSVIFPDLETIDSYGMRTCFQRCTKISGIGLPKLTTVGNDGLYYGFASCLNAQSSVDFPNLTNVSINSFRGTFQNCSNLASASFPNLTTVAANNAFFQCFQETFNLSSVVFGNLQSVNASYPPFEGTFAWSGISENNVFPALQTAGTSALKQCFRNCSNLTSFIFPSLTTIGMETLNRCFQYCTNITRLDFPNLTTVGSYAFLVMCETCTNLRDIYFNKLSNVGAESGEPFFWMLNNCSNVNVHFPSALESVINSWAEVQGGFHGTNTTVLFDL